MSIASQRHLDPYSTVIATNLKEITNPIKAVATTPRMNYASLPLRLPLAPELVVLLLPPLLEKDDDEEDKEIVLELEVFELCGNAQ